MKLIRKIHSRLVPVLALTVLISSILALAPATAAFAQATCSSAASDSDGDGWGWENNASCRVVESSTSNTSTSSGAECVDSDGDGWGWDGSGSCRISDTTPAPTTPSTPTSPTGTPACLSLETVGSNGWGFENGGSCRVLTPPTDMSVTVTPIGVEGKVYHTIRFTNSNTVEGLIGFKVFKDDLELGTVYCNERCDEQAEFMFGRMWPGVTVRYGVEPIVEGGGIQYSPRRDVYVSVPDFPETAYQAKEVSEAGTPTASALTAEGKAQRVAEESKDDFREASLAESAANREYEASAGNIEVLRVTTSTSETISLEAALRGEIEISTSPGVTAGAEVGAQYETGSGTSTDIRPRDGSPLTVARYEAAHEALNQARRDLADAAAELNHAIDQVFACSGGGGCNYTDTPVVTPGGDGDGDGDGGGDGDGDGGTPTTTPVEGPGPCEGSLIAAEGC